MGIGPDPEKMLRNLDLPQGFCVIELGDQVHHTGYRRQPGWKKRPARQLYEEMGCARYESIDANGRSTIFADLNKPLDPHPGEFDLVTDFGTSEHVWDIAQVWRTIHSLCKPGGLIAFDKPGQGYPDHGFWNSHGTLWRDLATANAYEIVHLRETPTERGTLWRGVYRKTQDGALKVPTQGKYRKSLKVA